MQVLAQFQWKLHIIIFLIAQTSFGEKPTISVYEIFLAWTRELCILCVVLFSGSRQGYLNWIEEKGRSKSAWTKRNKSKQTKKIIRLRNTESILLYLESVCFNLRIFRVTFPLKIIF
jgi:hypothetical protein